MKKNGYFKIQTELKSVLSTACVLTVLSYLQPIPGLLKWACSEQLW